ncbi:hypothetical protein C8R43DRAFT_1201640 [Mycena crocata]|nr:hypothetical protein C8R43DRAFT_1201640 [Mycena crocata]
MPSPTHCISRAAHAETAADSPDAAPIFPSLALSLTAMAHGTYPKARYYGGDAAGAVYVKSRRAKRTTRPPQTERLPYDISDLELKVGHAKKLPRRVQQYRKCESDAQEIVWHGFFYAERRMHVERRIHLALERRGAVRIRGECQGYPCTTHHREYFNMRTIRTRAEFLRICRGELRAAGERNLKLYVVSYPFCSSPKPSLRHPMEDWYRISKSRVPKSRTVFGSRSAWVSGGESTFSADVPPSNTSVSRPTPRSSIALPFRLPATARSHTTPAAPCLHSAKHVCPAPALQSLFGPARAAALKANSNPVLSLSAALVPHSRLACRVRLFAASPLRVWQRLRISATLRPLKDVPAATFDAALEGIREGLVSPRSQPRTVSTHLQCARVRSECANGERSLLALPLLTKPRKEWFDFDLKFSAYVLQRLRPRVVAQTSELAAPPGPKARRNARGHRSIAANDGLVAKDTGEEGRRDDLTHGFREVGHLYILDLAGGDEWRPLPAYPVPASVTGDLVGFSMVVHEDRAYFFTGHPEVDVFNLRTHTWSALRTSFPEAWPYPKNNVVDYTMHSVRGKIYVFGGSHDASPVGCTLFMELDIAARTWRALSGTALPVNATYGGPGPHRLAASWVGKDQNTIFVMYGIADRMAARLAGKLPAAYNSHSHDDIWSWDIAAGAWTQRRLSGNSREQSARTCNARPRPVSLPILQAASATSLAQGLCVDSIQPRRAILQRYATWL